jgi:hypothetical protein
MRRTVEAVDAVVGVSWLPWGTLSGRMKSLSIWYTSTIHDASPPVIAHGEGLPSRPVQAYHPGMTLCPCCS